MKRQVSVGRAEMDVLRYVADHYPITVREVANHIAETKGHTRTTVLNVMERLRCKEYLTREKVEGVYRYSPKVPKPQLLRGLVRDFVEGVLGGSVQPFVAYMAEDADLGEEELQELKRLVRDLDERKETGHE